MLVKLAKLVSVHFFDIWTSKKAQTPQFLTLLTSNVLRATMACTFSTFERGPNPSVLTLLTWKCALRHNACTFSTSQLQKVLWTCSAFSFLLQNVLRATPACNFSSLIWPAGSAPAALASLLFDPPEPQIIRKTQWIASFLPFRAPASSFFSDLLTSFLLVSDSSHLCFSNCPYCRKFHF